MGKNKKKAAANKKEKAFIVSSVKKAKTKPIGTHLKKMNLKSRSNQEKADESFKSLRKELVEAASTSKQAKHTSTANLAKTETKKATDSEMAVDMAAASEQLAKI